MKTISNLGISLMMTLFSIQVFSQSAELFAGSTYNVFYDTKDYGGHFQSNYDNGMGFSGGIALDSIMLDKLKCRFTLQFDQYKGAFAASNGGQAGGYSTDAHVSKSMVSLGIFPLTFDIRKRIHLGFGVLVSKTINESIKGTTYSWLLNKESTIFIQDTYDRYSASVTVGFQGRVAYDIPLTSVIFLTPQYIFHYGLTKEFDYFPTETRSKRHYFCIGLNKHF
jgi:hypothetical protein